MMGMISVLDRLLKEMVVTYFEALSRNLPGGTEIKHKNLTMTGVRDSVCFVPDAPRTAFCATRRSVFVFCATRKSVFVFCATRRSICVPKRLCKYSAFRL
jgi:hypothetical protein